MIVTSLRKAALAAVFAVTPVLQTAAATGAAPGSPIDPGLTPTQIEELVGEAVDWGMNLAGFYELRFVFTQFESHPAFRGVNRVQQNRQLLGAKQRFATTINSSTLYSGGMFDVSAEPVVVLTERVDETRYWSVQACDPYANWFFKIGSQFTGNGPQRYLIVGPKWRGKLPSGFSSTSIIRSTSDAFSMTLRVAVTSRDAADYAAAHRLMDGVAMLPLSLWHAHGDRPVPLAEQPIVRGRYPETPRMRELVDVAHSMTGVDYLQTLSLVLQDETITKREDSIFERTTLTHLSRLGLRPGVAFDPNVLTAAQRAAVEQGFRSARSRARARFAATSINMNGWKLQSSLYIDPADHEALAGAADVAWGTPVPFESHTIGFVFEDSEGQPLDGAQRYALSFDINALPPVSEFWELPVYDELGYFVDNPLDRYSATSYLYAAGAYVVRDGRLTFYLQSTPPADPDLVRNWLPTPMRGRFQLAARFYGPRTPLIDGTYPMPRIERQRNTDP